MRSKREMNNKKVWVIAALAAVIVIGAAAWLLWPAEKKPAADAEGEKPQQEQTEQTEQPQAEQTPEENQPESAPEESPVETPVPQETGKMALPYAIPDTELVIEALNSYDGAYLEDGSDAKAENILAMVVCNTGKQAVEYAEILLQGEKGTYRFHVTGLESQGRVVVQALEMAEAEEQDYQGAVAQVALIDEFGMAEKFLKIVEKEDGQLQVTNRSSRNIPCVRLFYKFYMSDQEVYVGGITYTVKLENLEAGESAMVRPSHYVPGSSRVIMARVYESAEG